MYLDFKKISRILPIATSLLVFWGILKLSIYYKLFNIKIISFLEFSEIITLFLNDIIFYTIILSLGFLLKFFVFDKYELDNLKDFKYTYFNEKKLVIRITHILKYNYQIMVANNIVFTILILIVKYKFRLNIIPLLYILAFSNSIFIINLFSMEFKRHYYLTKEDEVDPTNFNLSLIVAIITILVVFHSISDASNVKLKKNIKMYPSL